MGAAVLNTLTQVRQDIVDVLKAAGLNAIHYVGATIVPPVAIVVPADDYITTPQGENPFNAPYSINLQILVIGQKATNATAAENMDFLIASVVEALTDWDITEVTAPGEVSLKGITYSGAVLSLSTNTQIEKEVI